MHSTLRYYTLFLDKFLIEIQIMIDNRKKALALLEKMEACLPIPVTTTKELLSNIMQQENIEFPKDYNCQIENVHYFEDEGGICCGISVPDGAKKGYVVSLTHLRIHRGHPLAREIINYQEKRVKKLARKH